MAPVQNYADYQYRTPIELYAFNSDFIKERHLYRSVVWLLPVKITPHLFVFVFGRPEYFCFCFLGVGTVGHPSYEQYICIHFYYSIVF